jgi:hypothetical protein
MTAKPTVAELNIDLAAQSWQQSGSGDGAIEVAFTRAAGPSGSVDDWVLMRVTGDPEQRVLVFDRNEWDCFLDGARNGEFDVLSGSVFGSLTCGRFARGQTGRLRPVSITLLS